jgi:threonine dehydratase
MTPIDIASVRRAAERLAGRIVRTPLLASAMLDELAGAKVLVKASRCRRPARSRSAAR